MPPGGSPEPPTTYASEVGIAVAGVADNCISHGAAIEIAHITAGNAADWQRELQAILSRSADTVERAFSRCQQAAGRSCTGDGSSAQNFSSPIPSTGIAAVDAALRPLTSAIPKCVAVVYGENERACRTDVGGGNTLAEARSDALTKCRARIGSNCNQIPAASGGYVEACAAAFGSSTATSPSSIVSTPIFIPRTPTSGPAPSPGSPSTSRAFGAIAVGTNSSCTYTVPPFSIQRSTSSRESARSGAISACQSKGGVNCGSAVLEFGSAFADGNKCGALAYGRRQFSGGRITCTGAYGRADTESLARTTAIAQCNNRLGEAVCSIPITDAGSPASACSE